MLPAIPSPTTYAAHQESSWHARLALAFARRGEMTVLTRREHSGPLRVQKALYPEGPSPCHVILLHPPSGIAGGDHLAIHAELATDSHALLTTPGAGKWYRSLGAEASQTLNFDLASGSMLEWLPQETIFFDGAHASTQTQVRLEGNSRFLGWEILCLGRRASGESFNQGHLHLETRLSGDQGPLWLEKGRLLGDDPLLHSPVGLAGKTVCATLLAAGLDIDPSLLGACRAQPVLEADALAGITRLPRLLVARYLGHSSEAARHWLTALWQQLRPTFAGREAQTPRIWNT